ncbi:hypothetical protein [Pseudotabrizicola sp. 4114]|uniref:hypothetical protein n=1 Tax=Pseudotabrizicola sp. 4114 TaxID=2817731 RepID=UPI002855E950|nr:hypothetical protein [Pseudorhodobacter sp. 4114]
MPHALLLASLTAAFVALSACAGTGPVAQGDFAPAYEGIQTVLLQDDMVSFRVALQGARGNDDVEAYGRCAAAQYALIRGFGFARHVRTTVAQTGNTWRGDAVYLISAALPPGLKTIDAEVTVRDCGALGIPTI